jgi:hypothetical protein
VMVVTFIDWISFDRVPIFQSNQPIDPKKLWHFIIGVIIANPRSIAEIVIILPFLASNPNYIKELHLKVSDSLGNPSSIFRFSSKMYFIGKDDGPSIKEYIDKMKSKWGNKWKFWVDWNLRDNAAIWWNCLTLTR